jgi:hypothetical protein
MSTNLDGEEGARVYCKADDNNIPIATCCSRAAAGKIQSCQVCKQDKTDLYRDAMRRHAGTGLCKDALDLASQDVSDVFKHGLGCFRNLHALLDSHGVSLNECFSQYKMIPNLPNEFFMVHTLEVQTVVDKFIEDAVFDHDELAEFFLNILLEKTAKLAVYINAETDIKAKEAKWIKIIDQTKNYMKGLIDVEEWG